MAPVDLHPAAQRMADLIGGVPDELLDSPTPCPAYRLGDLLQHVGGAAMAFTAAATKAVGEATERAPSGDASQLEPEWRARIARDLRTLADAWAEPGAWTGMTQAGGVDLPGEIAGLVVLDELVIHGWDVAKASGQDYACDGSSLEAVHGFVSQFSGPGQEALRGGLFGPVVPVPDDAPRLDRVIGMAGRDPAWTPTG